MHDFGGVSIRCILRPTTSVNSRIHSTILIQDNRRVSCQNHPILKIHDRMHRYKTRFVGDNLAIGREDELDELTHR